MSKSVIPTPPQKIVITEDNEELMQKVKLSEIVWNDNTIMGNVSDKLTGKPIEGACIKICDNEYNPLAFNFTDIDGNFTLQGKFNPSIRVITGKRGYKTFSSDSLPSDVLNKKALNIELMPEPNGGIVFNGCVKNAQQKPLNGAKVTLYKAYSLNPYDFTFTNQDGIYLFDNIEPGTYRLVIQLHNYAERVINTEVGKGQPIVTLETIYMRKKSLKGTIHGIITDKNGLPAENALVVLCNSNNIPIMVTHTNEKGIYLFYNLDPGTYSIMAK